MLTCSNNFVPLAQLKTIRTNQSPLIYLDDFILNGAFVDEI